MYSPTDIIVLQETHFTCDIISKVNNDFSKCKPFIHLAQIIAKGAVYSLTKP